MNPKSTIHLISSVAFGIAIATAGLTAHADSSGIGTVPSTAKHDAASDASRDSTTRSMSVNYADLNLSQPAAIDDLYARLQRAARAVCSPREIRDLGMRSNREQCYESAMGHAVANIDNPGLSELYLAQTGRSAQAESRVAGTQ